MAARQQITLEQYLQKLACSVDNNYGRRIRQRFRDIRGSSELAMLAAPSSEELEQLKKAVAIMTPAEKANAIKLNDEQIHKIAADAGIDTGIFAIFINGYTLENSKIKT
jgi:signal recognition particle GTPase